MEEGQEANDDPFSLREHTALLLHPCTPRVRPLSLFLSLLLPRPIPRAVACLVPYGAENCGAVDSVFPVAEPDRRNFREGGNSELGRCLSSPPVGASLTEQKHKVVQAGIGARRSAICIFHRAGARARRTLVDYNPIFI